MAKDTFRYEIYSLRISLSGVLGPHLIADASCFCL